MGLSTPTTQTNNAYANNSDTNKIQVLVSGATNYNAYDYMIIYGTEDKMVPRYPEISGTFNQSIKTIDATKFN